jgi:uncharacterized repeat protein (TIGR01451 family)
MRKCIGSQKPFALHSKHKSRFLGLPSCVALLNKSNRFSKMQIKQIGVLLTVLLSVLLQQTNAAPTFNPATFDTPIDEVITFTGNNKVVVGGITLYPTLTANSFTVDIPACASGNPTITAAYLNWFHRSGIVDSPNSGGFDSSVDLSINAGPTQSVNSDQNYRAGIQYASGYNDYYHLSADVTAQLQSNLVAGSNSFSVSGVDVPTPGTWLRQNFGTGVTVIYSCPEFPYTKTSFFAGNDFFYCGNAYSGEYSSSYCMEFPASSSPRTIDLDAIYGGQTGSAPFRGGTYSYTTGTGSAPAMDGTTAFATGTIWNAANASVNPAWTSNLGTEWDKLDETVTIPANHTYMCMQSRSHEDVNTGECISLNHVAFTFSIPVDQVQGCTTVTNNVTISSSDQTDSDNTNNSSSADLAVNCASTPEVDISLTKTASPTNVVSGDTVTYTLTVSNAGPDTATGIEVTDQLPAGVTYISDTPSQGSYNNSNGIWAVGDLANGASATLMIEVTAD